MTTRIQLRRDTAARWASVNPVLAIGEPAVESDTGKLKVGDGTAAWASLPYILDVADLTPLIESMIDGIVIPPGLSDENVRDIVGTIVVGDGDYITVDADDVDNVVRIQPGAAITEGLGEKLSIADISDPETAGGSALRAAFGARHRSGFGGRPLWVFGTSYEAAGNGYVEDLAAALGSTVVHNPAQGGSNTPALPYQYVDSTEKWVPGTSTGDVLIGTVGDALSESDDPAVWKQSRDVYQNEIETALRWVRASAFRRMDHATVTLGAGVTVENFSVPAVPMVNAANVGPGETATLTPATTAREIALVSVAWRSSANATNNGVFKYRVDGGPWRTDTTVDKGDSRPDGSNVVVTLRTTRIVGLTPTSVIEVQGVSGFVLLYGYLVMGNPTPPSVMLMQPVPLIEVGGAWDFPGGEISENANKNNASQEKYRQIIRNIAVAPEFADGTVVVADPAPIWNAVTDLNADQIHPNATTGRVAHVNAALAAAQTVGR